MISCSSESCGLLLFCYDYYDIKKLKMVINAFCMSFQRLGVTAKCTSLVRYCSTNTSKIARNTTMMLHNQKIEADRSMYEPNFRLATIRYPILDANLPRFPPSIGHIHEFPTNNNSLVGEPPKTLEILEERQNEKSMNLPSNEKIIEKRAERMIVIRRRKMRKHKLKKLRKRMKFYWGKIKQRREMKKEKAFHALLLGWIKEAEHFDPESMIKSRLAILDNVRLPSRYRGELLPEAQIREFLRLDQEKKDKKFNKPRLTL